MRISDWSSDVCSSDLLAADLGPGKPGDRADLILAIADAVAELPHAREFRQIVGGDGDVFRLAFEDLAQRLARKPRDFALARADARLARVIADQVPPPRFGALELAAFQAVRLDLTGTQGALGAPDLPVP